MLTPEGVKIVELLKGIGLQVRVGASAGRQFVPGIAIEEGGLVVDPEQLLYPGDLLREGGHVAMMERPAARMSTATRATMATRRWAQSPGPTGRRGISESNRPWCFTRPDTAGVPSPSSRIRRRLLHRCADAGVEEPDRRRTPGARTRRRSYPHMLRWLCGPAPPDSGTT